MTNFLTRFLAGWPAIVGAANLLFTLPAQAQLPAVISVSPTRNYRVARPSAKISVEFGQRVNIASGIQLLSAQYRGARTSAVADAYGGKAATSYKLLLTPTAPAGRAGFRAGETVQVVVTSLVYGPNGGAIPYSSSFTVATKPASGVLAGSATVSVGATPQGVAVADVDNDGDLDLLSANTGANTVSLRLNNGLGGFSGSTDIAVGLAPVAIAVGDVDSDGDLDFVTANRDANTVSVRFNNAGSFGGTTEVAVGAAPNSVGLSDLNLDGLPDLFAASPGTTAGSVALRLNNGVGTFTTGTTTTLAMGAGASSVVAADADGDGDVDLLTANATAGTVSLILNGGNSNGTTYSTPGTFGGLTTIAVGGTPGSVVLADVNNDSNLDLLTTNPATNSVSLRLSDGRGAYGTPSTVGVGADPFALAVGDVDGDTDFDLLTANANGTVSVRRNNGLGGFDGNQEVATGTGTTALALADLNEDGRLDLAAASPAGLSLRFNNAPVALVSRTPTRYQPSAGPVVLTMSEDLDPATAGGVKMTGTAFKGRYVPTTSASGTTLSLTPAATQGRNAFYPGERVEVSVTPALRTTSGKSAQPAVYQFRAPAGTGPATFGPGVETDLLPKLINNIIDTETGDFDNDGDIDLAVVYRYAPTYLCCLLNTGDGVTYTVGYTASNFSYINDLAKGDINGDGRLDLLVTRANTNDINGVQPLLNTGSLASPSSLFRSAAYFPMPNPYRISLGDLDGDGDLDLLTVGSTASAGISTSSLTVALNDGQGNFLLDSELPLNVSSAVFHAKLADVDGDDDLDIVTAYASNTLAVALNDGQGEFTLASPTTLGSGAVNALDVGDVDNDGDVDVVVVMALTGSTSTVKIRLNDGAGNYTSSSLTPDFPLVTSGVGSGGLADLDGDGDLDFYANHSIVGYLSVRLNNGAGLFQAAAGATTQINRSIYVTHAADLDGDGDLDFISTTQGSHLIVSLNQPMPTILSFTPTSGAVGTQVTITGTGFTGTTAVAFNNVAASSFTVVSNTTIQATVGTTTTSGPITLTTPRGLVSSSSPFIIGALPTLTSVSPNPAAVGTSLALTGTNLTGATAVTFTSSGGVASAAPAGYVVASSTSLTDVIVPTSLAPGLYTLTVTTPLGTSNGLSQTVTAPAGPLPVALTQFVAAAEGVGAVRLAWATASEKNSHSFEVERSSNGVRFATIGTVAAAGTTAAAHTYALRDAALPAKASVLYYRLRQVDLDGTAHYSSMRVVALGGGATALFPNPAHGTATLTGVAAGQAVQVLDALGRLVLRAMADAGGTATLALPAGLPGGMYVVRAGQQALRLTVE